MGEPNWSTEHTPLVKSPQLRVFGSEAKAYGHNRKVLHLSLKMSEIMSPKKSIRIVHT